MGTCFTRGVIALAASGGLICIVIAGFWRLRFFLLANNRFCTQVWLLMCVTVMGTCLVDGRIVLVMCARLNNPRRLICFAVVDYWGFGCTNTWLNLVPTLFNLIEAFTYPWKNCTCIYIIAERKHKIYEYVKK